MVLNEKNKEKINDLKQLIELADNEYEKIINIFKKYAFSIEDAESYIIRYIPFFVKNINDKNALIIFKKKLDIYAYYLSLNEKLDQDTIILVKNFVNRIKRIDNKKVINLIARLGYKTPLAKIKFLLWVHNMIVENPMIKDTEEQLLLDRISSIQNELYCNYLSREKKDFLRNTRNNYSNYYNFVENLLKCDKSEWSIKISEFLSKQKDDVSAKNNLLRIFLMSKLDSSTTNLLKLYKLMDGFINPVVSYVKDPLSGELISKESYSRSYDKINNFFEDLMALSLDEKDQIISLYNELTKDRYYGVLDGINERLTKMFVAFYPDFPNAIEYINERTNIYIEYKNNLKKERLDKLKENNKILKERFQKETIHEEIIRLRGIFSKFIDGNYNIIEEFKKDFNIKGVELRESLKFIKENDPEFYNIIVKKQNDGMQVINEKVKSLSYYLRNGINNRAFDVIDFYLIYKMDIEVLRNVVQNMTLDNKYTLLRFLSSNIRLERLNVKVILNTLVEVNCEMDENGDLIKGTGFVIPRKIRENAIKFLEKNKIPLNDITYRTLINRYLMKNNIDHQYKEIRKR